MRSQTPILSILRFILLSRNWLFCHGLGVFNISLFLVTDRIVSLVTLILTVYGLQFLFWATGHSFIYQYLTLISLTIKNIRSIRKLAILVDSHSIASKFPHIPSYECYESLCSRRYMHSTDSQVRLASSNGYRHVYFSTKNRDARMYTRIPDVARFIVWHGMCFGYLPALTVHRRFAVLQGGC